MQEVVRMDAGKSAGREGGKGLALIQGRRWLRSAARSLPFV